MGEREETVALGLDVGRDLGRDLLRLDDLDLGTRSSRHRYICSVFGS
jgi:hypothetical protein